MSASGKFVSKKESPPVTIVVPAYNHEDYVTDCIGSILDQDYPNIELIVINDGSTDSTGTRIEGLLKKQKGAFRYISKENEGLAKTLNLGLKLAKGKYFSELASDDMLLPESIRRRVEFLEKNTKVEVVFADAYRVEKNMELKKRMVANRKRKSDSKMSFQSTKHTLKSMLENKADMFFPTGMFRHSLLKSLGGFDEDFHTEDLYLRYLLALKANVGYIDEALVWHRRHETNTSRSKTMWIMDDKVLALEKLLDCVEETTLKNTIKKHLFRKYMKYIQTGIEHKSKRDILKDKLGKAFTLRPWSVKIPYAYCKILLSSSTASGTPSGSRA